MDKAMRPVDVISVCTAAGELRPLRLRLEDESHQMLRINIDKVLDVQEIQHVGAEAKVFLCRARVWDRMWTFELKNSVRTFTWWLMRTVG